VIPVVVVLIVTTTMWLLCSFQGPQGGAPRDSRAGLSKLNSMHQLETRGMRVWQAPGPVDVLGRAVGDRRIVAARAPSHEETKQGERPATAPCRTGPLVRGSLERR
jgi:hypothetical protein